VSFHEPIPVRLDGPVSSEPRRIRWGILGTGHIAATFARDLALLTDEAELAAVGSRRLARAQRLASELGFARAHGSYEDLAADPALDVIYVATPHHDHFPSARRCLQAGKAVLVEKPLTVTPAEAEELIMLAGQRGVFLMEAMWMRTQPLIRKAVEIVDSAVLGTVRHVSASFGFAFDGGPSHRLLDPAQAGGAILDLGPYPVHATHLFLGEPDALVGYGSRAETGVDSHAAALLHHHETAERPAATASLVCSLETDLPTRLEVFCSDGRVIIDDFFIRPAEMTIVLGSGGNAEREVMITGWPGGGYTFQAQEVMRCLRAGETESPLVPWHATLAEIRTLARWQAALPGEVVGR
jgi:predicted dehydrogenase